MPRCPYVGCTYQRPTPQSAPVLAPCPTCSRLTALCPSHQCRELNRPLARFCRRCGFELGRNRIARAAEAEFPSPDVGRGSFLRAQTRTGYLDTPLLNLGPYIPATNPAAGFAVAVAAGFLWVGLPGGRYLFVEPFSAGVVRLDRRFGSPSGGAPIRAVVDGAFLAAYTDTAVQVECLLTFEIDAGIVGHIPLAFHRPLPTGREILGQPVFLSPRPISRDNLLHDRILVWLEWDNSAGLVLCSVYLGTLAARVGHSETPLPAVVPPAAGTTVGLVAVSDDPPAVAVATAAGVVLVDLPHGEAHQNVGVRPVPLPPTEFAVGAGHVPGVVFVSETSDGARPEPGLPFGRLYIGATNRDGGADLYLVQVPAAGGRFASPFVVPGAGRPVAVVTAGGTEQVLTVATDGTTGARLDLVNRLGHGTIVCPDPDLSRLYWAGVFGRVAVAVGRESSRDGWYTLVADTLERRVIDRHTQIGWAALPTFLGRHWFTVEPRGGETWLVRRELFWDPQ